MVVLPGQVPATAATRRSETGTVLTGSVGPGFRYLNRELSWLQFNERVLAIAEDPGIPPLERVKFAAIFASNLDEFFQVRVSGLMQQRAADVVGNNMDGMTPAAQLAAIRTAVVELETRHAALVRDELLPALARSGVLIVAPAAWTRTDREHLDDLFDARVFPVLTPLAVDPAHPFPYISDLSLNLAVLLRDRERGGDGRTASDPEEVGQRFARVKVPPVLPRLIALPGAPRFALLEDLIAVHLDRLFPGVEVIAHHLFRVTRNADLEIEEDEADDLLLAIESELNRRRFGRSVRLEVTSDMDTAVRTLLMRELGLGPDDVYVHDTVLGTGALMALTDLDLPELRLPSFTPVTPAGLAPPSGEPPDVLAVLRTRDVLVHHPYESFAATTQAFLEQAARDPDVLAIKVTLYRTSGPASPIARALLDAARAGKQVVVLVELKARFDEAANIGWARALEEAGAHVAYGVVGLKTHTKIALVVRAEGPAARRYVHIGTGNYNEVTGRTYEDLGLLSSDPDLGADLSDLFNVLTGSAQQSSYRRLVVAPSRFRTHILAMIAREAANDDGHIVAKVNALVDPETIDALYRASQAGTRVELFVRGICCLRPGVPGLSDGITVRSIVGRYLEHSRLYRFGSDARGLDYLIGSGDLMPRNLDRRVEALVPVTDPALQSRLEEIIDLVRADDLLAWELGPDARWRRVTATVGIDSQATLQERARRRSTHSIEPLR
jgi:polyphosphate kinase